ncbi:MAG: GHMP kinase [Thermoplasmata archaeon]|nr:MAG: GHMP kinase [Thermoplasmata archaeon]
MFDGAAMASLTPIKPGTWINRVSVSHGKVRVRDYAVKVRVPARVHLSVIDMRRFAPGRPGGGGVGYALGAYVEATVNASKEYAIEAGRRAVVEHIARIVAKAVGYNKGFEIRVGEHGINHMGLGSTSAVLSAVAYGVNHVLGNPLDIRDLRMLIGYNFVEEWDDAHVVPGFETGVGPAAAYYGGFFVIGDCLEIICRCELPGKEVHVFIPKDVAKNYGEDEVKLLLTKAREMDDWHAESKSHEIVMRLIPSMLKGDVKAMGECVWRLQNMGSKVAEIKHHECWEEIYEFMKHLRSHGAEIVGMSSVGPAITAVSKVGGLSEKIAHDFGIELSKYIKTHIDNHGVVWEKVVG